MKKEQLEACSGGSHKQDNEWNIETENIWVKSEFKPQIEHFTKVSKEETETEDNCETHQICPSSHEEHEDRRDGGNSQNKGGRLCYGLTNIQLYKLSSKITFR